MRSSSLVFFSFSFIFTQKLFIYINRVATLPGNLEKYWNWQFKQKKKNLERPGVLSNFYM